MFGLRESFVRAARRAAELPKLGARGWSSEAASGAKPKANQAASRLSALETETAEGHKLFENVRLPAEADAAMAGSGAGASAGAAAAAGTAAAAAAGTRSTAARIANAAGNVIFLGGLGAAGYLGYYQYSYDVDSVETMVQETRKPENSFPGSSLWVEAMEKYVEWRRYFESEARKYADPPSECLLPDLPPNAKHVRTLVLDLDDVLVHSDWTRGRGWRTFKRPGVDAFLNSLSDYYELVVYTSQLPTYADPILDRLDPERTVQFRLYRDSTRYVDGHHVRDLSTLNRDPKQMLLITADPDAYSLQPDNAIKLKPWKLENEDTTLLDLLPFLEAIVRTGVPDVRDVVRSYEGSDIPTAFRERMARVQESQAQTQRRGFFSSWSKRS